MQALLYIYSECHVGKTGYYRKRWTHVLLKSIGVCWLIVICLICLYIKMKHVKTAIFKAFSCEGYFKNTLKTSCFFFFFWVTWYTLVKVISKKLHNMSFIFSFCSMKKVPWNNNMDCRQESHCYIQWGLFEVIGNQNFLGIRW